MDLIFWRHAEALDAIDGQEDLLRELTSKGEKQAAKMGTWLDRQLPEGVRVMCSPATRALGLPAGELTVRKGALWWLRSRVRDGVPQTVVVSVQTPELI